MFDAFIDTRAKPGDVLVGRLFDLKAEALRCRTPGGQDVPMTMDPADVLALIAVAEALAKAKPAIHAATYQDVYAWDIVVPCLSALADLEATLR